MSGVRRCTGPHTGYMYCSPTARNISLHTGCFAHLLSKWIWVQIHWTSYWKDVLHTCFHSGYTSRFTRLYTGLGSGTSDFILYIQCMYFTPCTPTFILDIFIEHLPSYWICVQIQPPSYWKYVFIVHVPSYWICAHVHPDFILDIYILHLPSYWIQVQMHALHTGS